MRNTAADGSKNYACRKGYRRKSWQNSLIYRFRHIETANTKLSLPALLSIANAFGVLVDDIVPASLTASKLVYDREMQEMLADCDRETTRYLVGLVKAAKGLMKEMKE